MKENANNKNITLIERRILKSFFALSDREKKLKDLVDLLGISLSTAKRYVNILEKANLARIINKDTVRSKKVSLRKNIYFSIVRIGKNTVDISIFSFLPKYEYFVVLTYNEALTEFDNVQYIKSILDKLYVQMRVEKVFTAFVVSELSCIGNDVLNDTYSDIHSCNFESEFFILDKRKAPKMSDEEIISALVVEDIRNVRIKTVD